MAPSHHVRTEDHSGSGTRRVRVWASPPFSERLNHERLNQLFSTVHPPTLGPYRCAEVIVALRAHGVVISAPYLSQLRTDSRKRPSPRTQEGLAKVFGVRPEYFTDDQYCARIEQELLWCSLIGDPDVRRMLTDIGALTEPDRHQVRALLEHLRHDPTPP